MHHGSHNERHHQPTQTPSGHATHTHLPMTSTTLGLPAEHSATQVYQDHRVMPQPNPPPSVRHQQVSVYAPPDRQPPHPPAIRFHDPHPQQQGSLSVSPRDALRNPPYNHPTAQTHVVHGAPHYSVQYAPPSQHVLQHPPYGMPAVQQHPQQYPHHQAQLSASYVAYYSVPGAQHPHQVPANPVAPSQVPPLPQQEALVYETAAPGPQVQSTIYVPVQGRPYYPHDIPDPTGPHGTVVQRSYYHPGATTNVLVARQDLNPRTSVDLPPFGNHSHSQPVISSTMLSNPPRPTQEPNMMGGSAVYPAGSKPQEQDTQEVPRAQVVAKLAQPLAYPLVTHDPNKIASPPLAYNGLQHQGYQRHGPGPDREVPIQAVPHLHSAPPVTPQAVPHGTAAVLAPALPPHPVVPTPQQPSTFPDYSHGAYQGARDMYGNALRLHNLYGAPPTLHYVTPHPAPKKRRLQWTPELHAKFEAAINDIGIDTAVPKTLLQAMNEPSLTRENVASHLQKYREMIRKKRAENRRSGSPPSRKRSISDLGGSSGGHCEAEDRKNERVSSGSGRKVVAEKNSNSSKGQSTSRPNDTKPRGIRSETNQTVEDSGSFADTNETRMRSSSRDSGPRNPHKASNSDSRTV